MHLVARMLSGGGARLSIEGCAIGTYRLMVDNAHTILEPGVGWTGRWP